MRSFEQGGVARLLRLAWEEVGWEGGGAGLGVVARAESCTPECEGWERHFGVFLSLIFMVCG